MDRVTKYALFIPTRDNTSAANFAELFFEHVETKFGTPSGIVTDRDSRITSDFWKERIISLEGGYLQRTIVTKLHELREDLREKLLSARERMKKYYDQRHTPKQFRRGDLVKLSTTHLKLKSGKLGPRWVGPFRILERIGGQAYRLALPEEYSRLHNVFPIQLLEQFHPREDTALLPMPELEDNEEEWEVEEVRGMRKAGQKKFYLVKWAGWPSEYNSYEPEEHMENAWRAVKAFEKKNRAVMSSDGRARKRRR